MENFHTYKNLFSKIPAPSQKIGSLRDGNYFLEKG